MEEDNVVKDVVEWNDNSGTCGVVERELFFLWHPNPIGWNPTRCIQATSVYYCHTHSVTRKPDPKVQAQKEAKAVKVGATALKKKTKKIRTSVIFHRPKTLKKACNPNIPVFSMQSSHNSFVTMPTKNELFRVIYKVPIEDNPYVKVKVLQLVGKDPNGDVALFWVAINAGEANEAPCSALKMSYGDGSQFIDPKAVVVSSLALLRRRFCFLKIGNLSLPMEDGLLDNIDIPGTALTYHAPNKVIETKNTWAAKNRIAFENSGNLVMALVAFPSFAVWPRVATTCVHVTLVVLSKDDCIVDALGDSSLCKVAYAGSDKLIPENRPRENGKQDVAQNSIK
eukprot:Gb_04878 [translate_table: standard]